MQNSSDTIPASTKVKDELRRRKKVLSARLGRQATFDEVLRDLLGWRKY